MKNGKIVLGALAGLAIGSIIGILFAPEKGSRTRRKIVDKGEDYADMLKEKVNEYSKTMKSKYESSLNDVKNLVDHETK